VASSAGMALALVSELVSPKTAYLQMLGAAFFGGLFVWMMILATHIRFRRRFTGKLIFRAPFYPWASASGIAALAAITISTWWVPGMKITLIAGLPWLAFISLCYLLKSKSSQRV